MTKRTFFTDKDNLQMGMCAKALAVEGVIEMDSGQLADHFNKTLVLTKLASRDKVNRVVKSAEVTLEPPAHPIHGKANRERLTDVENRLGIAEAEIAALRVALKFT